MLSSLGPGSRVPIKNNFISHDWRRDTKHGLASCHPITILQSVSRGLISDICVASHYCVTVTITAIHRNIVIITEVFSHKYTKTHRHNQ